MQIERNVQLAPLTTFKIGGVANVFVRAKNVDDIREAIALSREKGLPFFVLGGGSNTLVDDAGFNGVVIKMEMLGVEYEYVDNEFKLLLANAGESWDPVVAGSVQNGLWGLENLSGIPGTIGASPVQNIGAYGAEVANTIEWVETFNTESGEIKKFTHGECLFGYRTSRFKLETGRYIILRVAFRVSKNGLPNLFYKDLREAFAQNTAPTPKEIREKILEIRVAKFPDLKKEGTAGSFFLNPVISPYDALRILQLLPGIPQFSQQDGRVKISLAYMLEKGLGLKGFRIGGVRLFEKQPLVMVADFGASSYDVFALCEVVQKKVYEIYGILIEPEVRTVSA